MSNVELKKRRPLTTPLNDADWENNRKYGVIIDAGSSGSRIYVYSWKDHEYLKGTHTLEELKGNIPIVERADKHGLKWTHRVEPGISTYGSKPNDIKEHLKELLDFALEVVPSHQQLHTPVFLMATAGVRLLPNDVQGTLMKATCDYIKETTPFFISNCDTHIRAIPGELEGAYGWVAINYLMGGFDASIQPPSQQQQQHTFGFLDMGGASAQIAFEPEHHQKEEHSNDLTKIHLRTLDGRALDYDVFVTTFLGYGSNEARRRYLEHRVKMVFDAQLQQQQQQQEGGGKLSNKKQMDLLDDHHRLPLDDPCLPLNLEITDSHSTSVTLQLKGTGQFDKCLDATLPLLNKHAACPTLPCLFDGIHTPKIDWSIHKFVGISEYWYSSHDVLGLGGVYDFVEYEKKATAFCSKDWESEVKEHPDWDPVEIQRYQLQCFKSAWIVNVLHSGIEVPRIIDSNSNNGAIHDGVNAMTTTINSDGTTTMIEKWKEQSIESVEDKNWNPPFQSIDTINDIQVSWTLGAMLLHVANQIPLLENEDGMGGGHSSDDELPHPIADGVELPPEDNTHPPPIHDINNSNNNNWQSIPDDSNYINSSWWDLGNTVSVIGLFGMLFVLFGVVLWEWYRQTKKRRRNEYRRVDTNGGILGNVAATTTTSASVSSLLAGPFRLMKNIAISPMVFLKYWTSRIIPFRSGSSSMVGNNNLAPSSSTEPIYQIDMAGISNDGLEQLEMNNQHIMSNINNGNINNNNTGIDNMTIPIYDQQLAQQQQQQLNGSLGISNKTSSMISMKYWQKKRYSGDSHHISQIMQPGYNNNNSNNDMIHGFRNGSTSAVGLPNRTHSSSSLIARTGSPSIISDVQTNTSMTRSRSRVGFTIHETSDEDDYINYSGGTMNTVLNSSSSTTTVSGGDIPSSSDLHRFTSISRTPSPSIAMSNFSKRSTNSTAPSPKGSPRNSLEKM
ncbi:nucleoside phosphatase family-domain-containing protein [Cunninghamella echinulata]|nr:nucleoside phosphatase family-domain-containing protein [Cunninghamella echinulata]